MSALTLTYESLCINKLANWVSSFPVHPKEALEGPWRHKPKPTNSEKQVLGEFTLFMHPTVQARYTRVLHDTLLPTQHTSSFQTRDTSKHNTQEEMPAMLSKAILRFATLRKLSATSFRRAVLGGRTFAASAEAPRHPLPPFTVKTALEKVQKAEDAWNTRDPAKVNFLASIWTGIETSIIRRWPWPTVPIPSGEIVIRLSRAVHTPSAFDADMSPCREQIRNFLKGKWDKELDYKLQKMYW
eukprot:1023058-Amorphochlora_amoeboformis.AAC.1